mmetsp:Transcript_17931/g.49747  ORF Transcript_17931/g.49747 Transcript_17931/m.49747 type:complete len:211 (+) Transcript_17931:141-773(+)
MIDGNRIGVLPNRQEQVSFRVLQVQQYRASGLVRLHGRVRHHGHAEHVLDIPHPHAAIVTACCQRSATAAEGQAVDHRWRAARCRVGRLVRPQLRHLLPRPQIPQMNDARVVRCACVSPARRDLDIVQSPRTSVQQAHAARCLDVPQPRRLVVRAREDVVAVGVENDGVDALGCVTGEETHRRSSIRGPHACSRIAPGRSKIVAAGGESN